MKYIKTYEWFWNKKKIEVDPTLTEEDIFLEKINILHKLQLLLIIHE
jgi:hypothetical protein